MITRLRFWGVLLGAAATAFVALGYLGAGARSLPSRTNPDGSQPMLGTVAAKDECACHGQKGRDCCGSGACACGTAHRMNAAPAR